MSNRRTSNGQTDYLTDLSLSALSAPMAPAHCYDAKALSALQKSLLGHAPHTVYIYALLNPVTRQIRYKGHISIAIAHAHHLLRKELHA